MRRFLLRASALLLSLSFAVMPVAYAEKADDAVLYAENFERGTMPGWVSYEEKSCVEKLDSGYAYSVKSYDYHSASAKYTDYEFRFDMKIDYKEPGTTAPSIYVRRGADGNRYEMYIESHKGRMVIDRVINEQKTTIGELKADFAADNLEWVTMKIIMSGKNIHIYYKDMDTPALALRDESALLSGGIGFGFGNADFYVDNIEIKEMSDPLPEPHEINPEERKDYKNSPYREAIDLLRAMGIVNAFEDGSFRPDNPITRAEFAALAVRARNVKSVPAAAMEFDDVDPNNWAAPVIASACALGYMSGISSDKFAPSDPITLEQASKVLVKVLGAEIMAERRGGYPTGYLAYAAQSGITDGVDKNSGEALTRGEVAKLIANTLNAEILKQTGFGDMEEYLAQDGATPLTEYHSIYQYRGRITANYYAGIYADEPIGKNEFMLDGFVMNCGNADISDRLGFYVKLYAHRDKASGELTAVYFNADEDKTNALVISAEDILDASGLKYIRYIDESGETSEALLSKNTNIILNSGSAEFSEENLIPSVGGITLIDTDDNGDYDVALVESYTTMVVGSASESSQKIIDKFDTSLFVSTDGETSDISLIRGYQEIGVSDLEPLEVLSVAESGPRASHGRIKILSSLKKITGKISEYAETDDGESVVINSKSYPMSTYLLEQIALGKAEAPNVGSRAVLHLDRFGKVAYIKQEQSSEFMLLNGVMWLVGADSGWLFEVLDSSGKWNEVMLADEVTYNGSKQSFTQDNLPEELKERRVIHAKFNRRGEIATINTESGDSVLKKSRDYTGWAMEYIASTRSFDTDSYVDENTLVFAVPFDASEKNGFSATDSSYFKGGSTYQLISYNEDKFEVADIVLVFEKKDAGGNGKLARPFFFESMTSSADKDGSERIKINGYRGGEKISFIMAEGTEAELNCGDALTLSHNAKGEVVALSHLYRVSNGTQGSNNSGFGMSSDRVTVCGTVIDFDASTGRALLDVGITEPKEKAFIISKAQNVYCCYKSREKIFSSSVGEICVGDFLVMDFSWNSLRDIMIYR